MAPAVIDCLGVLTANRPSQIGITAAQALRQIDDRGRDITLFVADGSRTRDAQRVTRGVVTRLRDRRAVYLGTREKARIVGRLAQRGFDGGLLHRALASPTAGSQRNLLLLLGAGKIMAMADDDIRLTMWRLATRQAGVEFVGDAESRHHRFCARREDALSGCRKEPENLFACHEALLGHSPVGLTDHHGPPPRVRVTMTGIIGDSGTYCPFLNLFADGTLRAALVRDRQAFDQAFSSREVQRVASKSVITRNPRCMAGCVALDNRELTPPFMWMGSNEDGVFGMMFAAIDRRALFGHLPCAVLHASDRPPVRTCGAIASATETRLSDFMLAIAGRMLRSAVNDVRQGFNLGAHWCGQVGGLAPDDFRMFARTTVRESRRYQLAQLAAMVESGDYPDYWRAAAVRFREECLRSMDAPSFSCAVDVARPGVSLDERFARMQAFIRDFGRLLEMWPDLHSVAISGAREELLPERSPARVFMAVPARPKKNRGDETFAPDWSRPGGALSGTAIAQ